MAVESKLSLKLLGRNFRKVHVFEVVIKSFVSTCFACFKFFRMKEIVKQNKLNKDVTQQKCSTEMIQIQIKLHKFPFLMNLIITCRISG